MMSQEQEKERVPTGHGSQSGKGHLWHLALMFLCCLIPLGILFFTIGAIAISSNWSWLASLICPLMMVGMMVMMCWGGKEKK